MRKVSISDLPKDSKVVNGKLFFGERECKSSEFITDKDVAALYVIRVNNGDTLNDGRVYWEFVTGLDIVNGKYWLAGVFILPYGKLSLPSAHFDEWSSVEHVMNKLCENTAGKEWAIFEEEDFEKQMNESSE